MHAPNHIGVIRYLDGAYQLIVADSLQSLHDQVKNILKEADGEYICEQICSWDHLDRVKEMISCLYGVEFGPSGYAKKELLQ